MATQACYRCHTHRTRGHYTRGAWQHGQAFKRECRHCVAINGVFVRETRWDPDHEARSSRQKKRFKRNQCRLMRQQFELMGLAAVTRCQSCGNRPTRRKPLQLDHLHGTFKLRGKLCGLCNRSLGNHGDNASSVVKMARYLTRAALEDKSVMVTADVVETEGELDGLVADLLRLRVKFDNEEQIRLAQDVPQGEEPEDEDYEPGSDEEEDTEDEEDDTEDEEDAESEEDEEEEDEEEQDD